MCLAALVAFFRRPQPPPDDKEDTDTDTVWAAYCAWFSERRAAQLGWSAL